MDDSVVDLTTQHTAITVTDLPVPVHDPFDNQLQVDSPLHSSQGDGFGTGELNEVDGELDNIDGDSISQTGTAGSWDIHVSADVHTPVPCRPISIARPKSAAVSLQSFDKTGFDREFQELDWRRVRRQNQLTVIPTLQFPWERSNSSSSASSIPHGQLVSVASIAQTESIMSGLNSMLPEPLTKRPKLSFAARCINKLTLEQSEDLLRQRALDRWRLIVESDLTATSFGRMLVDEFDSLECETRIVLSFKDAFARKSTATLAKRSGCLMDYLKWARTVSLQSPLQLTETKVYSYICHLRHVDAAPSKASSFISALRFSQYSIGLSGVNESLSARVLGASSAMLVKKAPLKQATPLTVEQVKHLESIALDSADVVSRLGAGYFCLCLFSCSRFSDSMYMNKLTLEMAAKDFGFVEGRTVRHKTATTEQRKTTFLPMVSFARGLLSRPWAVRWFEDRKEQNLDALSFTMPAPLRNNQWSARPLTAGEGSQWLRELLVASGCDDVQGLSTHSLKCTLLTWAAKMIPPVSLEHRRILGHHMDSSNTSALTYSRDAMSGPLQVMETVLEAVRRGVLKPDETRAQRAAEARNLVEELGNDLAPADEIQSTPAREDFPEVETQSESDGSVDAMREEVDDETEAKSFEVLDRKRLSVPANEDVFVNKFSGLGHIVKPNGTSFRCGKQMSLAYESALSRNREVIMCLACKPNTSV